MIAGTTTPEAAVGTDFRTLDVWSPNMPTAESWEAVRQALLAGMGGLANKDTELNLNADSVRGEDEDPSHVSINIPVSVIDEESGNGPNLINYAGIVGEHLGLKQLRYGIWGGSRKSRLFVGFSGPLSPQEAEVCRANGLWQAALGRVVDDLSVHEDGSQTLQYRRQFTAADRLLGRIQMTHANVIENVAPNLEGGVVVTPITVEVQERQGYPTLFTPPQEQTT